MKLLPPQPFDDPRAPRSALALRFEGNQLLNETGSSICKQLGDIQLMMSPRESSRPTRSQLMMSAAAGTATQPRTAAGCVAHEPPQAQVNRYRAEVSSSARPSFSVRFRQNSSSWVAAALAACACCFLSLLRTRGQGEARPHMHVRRRPRCTKDARAQGQENKASAGRSAMHQNHAVLDLVTSKAPSDAHISVPRFFVGLLGGCRPPRFPLSDHERLLFVRFSGTMRGGSDCILILRARTQNKLHG